MRGAGTCWPGTREGRRAAGCVPALLARRGPRARGRASSGARRSGRGEPGTPGRTRGGGLRGRRGGRGRGGAAGVSPRALEGGGKRALRAGRGRAARGELAMPEPGCAGSDSRCLAVAPQHFAEATVCAQRASASPVPRPPRRLACGPDAPGPPPLPLPVASSNSASIVLVSQGLPCRRILQLTAPVLAQSGRASPCRLPSLPLRGITSQLPKSVAPPGLRRDL